MPAATARHFEPTPLPRPDGARLALRAMPARGEATGAVVIAHGMAEHAGRYRRFAEALSDAGHAVFAADHRGHGATTAPGAADGHFGAPLDTVLDDLEAVVSHARAQAPGVPLTLFGHSMGSILSLAATMRNPRLCDRLACWNSGVDGGALLAVFDGILRTQQMFLGSDVPSTIARKLTFETWNKRFAPNRTDFDWLSRDEAEVDAYVADPKCGFPVTIGLWRTVLDAVRMGGDDRRLAKLPKGLPVHLLGGADDPCSDDAAAMKRIANRMRAAGMGDVTFVRLPGTRHESLNELNREETTDAFVAWLEQREETA